jgi:small-conductance mechanosensitive channel
METENPTAARDGLPEFSLLRVEYWTLGFGLLVATFAAGRWGWVQAAGVCFGTVISWVNFRWLKQGVGVLAALSEAQAGQEKVQIPKSVYFKSLGRFVLLIIVLYAILSRPGWPAAAVLCGLFAAVAGALAEMIYYLVEHLPDRAGRS